MNLGLRVPRQVGSGADEVTVRRAWPSGETHATAVEVRIEGVDPAMRVRAGKVALDRDGAVLAATIGEFGRDPKLPELGSASGSLIAHRWGRRAVLRDGGRYTKVVRSSAARAVLDRNTLGAGLAARAGFAVAVPSVGDEGHLHSPALDGVTLHRRESDLAIWERIWRLWAQAWPRLAGQDARLPTHAPEAEARVVEEWVSGVVARGILTDPGGALAGAASRVADDLCDGTADTAVIAHRDLHDQQLVYDVDSHRLGILDLDTCAKAEPALDLGNLAVHAALRVAQGLWSAAQADIALEAISDVTRQLAVSPSRLEVALRAAGLRVSAVYAYRPAWQDLAGAWARAWSGTGTDHPVGVDGGALRLGRQNP